MRKTARAGKEIMSSIPLPEADMDRLDQDDTGEMTDHHVSTRMAAELLAGKWCWCSGLGWMQWDGKIWKPMPSQAVRECASKWASRKYQERTAAKAQAVTEQDYLLSRALDDEIAGWKRYLLKTRLDAIVSLAEGKVLRDIKEFDSHPDLLNVGNGVVDLRTGELSEHDPKLMLTQNTRVDYYPGAEHQDWKSALGAVPDDVQEWYQIKMGQGITGHMAPDDVMLVQVGNGSNGKSTVLAGIQAAIGDYFHLVPHKALLSDPNAHSTEKASFLGKRLALLEETPEERRLNVTSLKQLVGTPQITARFICKDNITFNATHTLFVSTNYLPQVSESDGGTWRRLACLTFPYKFVRAPQSTSERVGDPGLRARLPEGHEQREAVLAWLVAGAVAWYKAARVIPEPPARVRTDTDNWRGKSDPLVEFITDHLEFDAGYWVDRTDLYSCFKVWLEQGGKRVWNEQTFYARLESHELVPEFVEQKRAAKPAISWGTPSSGFATRDAGGGGTTRAFIGIKLTK